ncbi:hypothetical protein ACNFU2_09465 [Chryseobacterium sp. PTM-20240506]|uniref:hypothetical protein n=1 Tax=unclassified Chryseobacterium TaxID=2593645 RepID=UPI001553DB79|nr:MULTISPECIES: hypothetical protein [unclassified Chryseobacterium]MDC8105123.1 hyaluronidase [Chryseobacterium sp. B21-037]MDQ1805382.1 hypothetical protein [Chryseobacterium sp. CKR4-1]WBV58537.1 hypothetical protein PFY10_08765 [Chryseobacterium daecheongense]
MQTTKYLKLNSPLLFLITIILLVFSNRMYGQQPKLYIGMTGLNQLQETYIKQNGLEKAIIFYQKDVTTDGSNLDVELFTKNINDKTSAGSTGIAVIDWEGPAIKAISGSDDKSANLAIQQFVKAVETAKKLRPNLKWGFYGLPVRTFKGNSSGWKDVNARLAPVFNAVDIIAPSLYMYNANPRVYNARSPILEVGSGDYLYTNLDYALEVGKKYNKDVYPFIWQKRNSGNSNMAMSLIPIDIFKNYYKMITSRVSSGKKVSGVIWWDSQKYFYLNRQKYPALQKEYSNVKDVEQYDLDVFKTYYNATK